MRLPYLFEFRLHFFVVYGTKISPKKSGATYTRMHEVQCMPYKIFVRYFLAIDFYTVAYHTIILLITFHASNVALLTLSPFFHVASRLVIRLSSMHASHATLHHLSPSWDADKDVPEVNENYLMDSESSDDFDGF